MNRVIVSMALISCLAFFSCKDKQPPPTPPTPVNLYTVAAQPVSYYDTYPSTTEGLSQVSLLPQVQGYVTGIFFTEGTFVKKGQKLYQIDGTLYQQNYEAAVANLKVQQGTLKQSQEDADRYEYLNSQNAVAKQLYDHAVITLQNSKNQVQSSEEAVKTAKTNLDFSIIYAPFDGTIGFSQVKLGNLVTVGQTVLNTISTNDPIGVDFLISEKQLADFEKLQSTKQQQADSLFSIVLPNNAIYPYTGKMSVIDRAVDPQTGSLRIRLIFPNPANTLKVGMSCIVRVHNQNAAPQMVIPGKAIVEQMGEYFVFLAKDTTGNAPTDPSKAADTANAGIKLRAIEQKVQVGRTIGANIVILSGITVGDKVIIDGVQAVHDGSPIAVGDKHPSGKDSTGNKNN
ncbi:MAG TPA: efflux RND transporter periplasmic adaptor subunit [Ferruginibacter sp.]|jgi:RND family efflux transporter MFP subunit|nr:efflux RND transporter periplasmic adaptor subunit [Ferruginibacter sp.]